MTTLLLPAYSCSTPRLKHTRKGFGLLEVILVFAIVIGAAAVLFAILPSANRAADTDHDRTMTSLMATQVLQSVPSHWDASNGNPQAANNFYANPKLFGGNFCDPAADQSYSGGCFSSLTGVPVGMGEDDEGGAQAYGAGVSVTFPDMSTDQCIALLSGGTASIGASAAGTDSTFGTVLKTQADVVTFCNNASPGGYIDTLYVDYAQSGAWLHLN